MKISLEAVEALDAVVRHGSFAAAAKSLRKAQSAVSYGIKQLEEGLGVALFDRRGHRAILTEAGQMVLEEGRVLLARVKRVESLAARFHEDWEPRVEAVLDGIFPMQPVLSALKRMADDGVPTSIQIKVEFLGGVQDRFEKDGADLMLVKDYVRSHALVEHALPDVEVVLVAAAGHPLVSGEGALTLADLQRHVELTVHDSSESKRLVDNRLFGGQRVFFLSDFFTKKQAVSMGLGFGWMPLYLVEDELAQGALREVPYRGGSRYAFAPMLVHPRDKPLGRAGSMLLALLGETSGVRPSTRPVKRRRARRRSH
ncbi:MAG: LysR family transcriptional regulator [Polyangiaceae bacterium]